MICRGLDTCGARRLRPEAHHHAIEVRNIPCRRLQLKLALTRPRALLQVPAAAVQYLALRLARRTFSRLVVGTHDHFSEVRVALPSIAVLVLVGDRLHCKPVITPRGKSLSGDRCAQTAPRFYDATPLTGAAVRAQRRKQDHEGMLLVPRLCHSRPQFDALYHELCSCSWGSSAFAAGQVKRQVKPESG
jgi:hypothetical protein